MLDRAYLFLYAALYSPKRAGDIFDRAAFVLAYGISMHTWVCALAIYKYGYHQKIGPGIRWIGAGSLLLILTYCFIVYVIRGRGQYLIGKFSAELRLKRTKVIGRVIAIWILGFPILFAFAMFVHRKLQ